MTNRNIETKRLVGTLLMEQYAIAVEDHDARLRFSEAIADILHDAVATGVDAATVLQRAFRVFWREFGDGPISAPTIVVPAVEHPGMPRVEERADPTWESPPAGPNDGPKWEEPPDTSTTARGRFARREQDMRDNPNRWLVLAEDVSGSYASKLKVQFPEFEFEHKRMRRRDARSFKVWSRYIGRPNLKAHEAG